MRVGVVLVSVLPGVIRGLRGPRETLHVAGAAVSLGRVGGLDVAVVPPGFRGSVEGRRSMFVGLALGLPPVRDGDVVVAVDGAEASLLLAARGVGEDEWIPEHYSPVAHFGTVVGPRQQRRGAIGVAAATGPGTDLAVYGVHSAGASAVVIADAGDAAASYALALVRRWEETGAFGVG